MQDEKIIAAVRHWVQSFVVAYNLCPFAGREMLNKRVRFALTRASDEAQLLQALQAELALLDADPSIETSLLIHPQVLQAFDDYNQFLDDAEELLRRLQLEGVYQVASFHPYYQFDGSDAEDVENYTNRSPYPLLHLLREQSLERAIADYADVDQIPTRNIERMQQLGQAQLAQLMRACLETTH